MSIDEFVESIWGTKLMDYQKDLLRKVYEYRKTNKSLPRISRGNASKGLFGAEIMCVFYDEFITDSEE